MSEYELEQKIVEFLRSLKQTKRVETFEEAEVCGYNQGVCARIGKKEFQITIVEVPQ